MTYTHTGPSLSLINITHSIAPLSKTYTLSVSHDLLAPEIFMSIQPAAAVCVLAIFGLICINA